MKTLNEVIDDITFYYAGSELDESYTEKQREIIASYNSEFDNVECDPEGPTASQEEEMDNILTKCALAVLANNYYISWFDGVNSGFIDYNEDYVTDELYERAKFFETKEDAVDFMNSLIEKYGKETKLEVCVTSELF